MPRTCKNTKCKKKFEPKQEGQVVCSYPCSTERAKQLREIKLKKTLLENTRRNREIKEKNKTLSTHKKELQMLVNRYVRNRDRSGNCVSCDRPLKGKFDAGHFWSLGGYPSVRFDLNNIWGQCVHCNRDLHGNLLPYRARLIKRIGREAFDDLATRAQESNKMSIPEVINLKRLFKEKLKLQK